MVDWILKKEQIPSDPVTNEKDYVWIRTYFSYCYKACHVFSYAYSLYFAEKGISQKNGFERKKYKILIIIGFIIIRKNKSDIVPFLIKTSK